VFGGVPVLKFTQHMAALRLATAGDVPLTAHAAAFGMRHMECAPHAKHINEAYDCTAQTRDVQVLWECLEA
jgi:hypothetical protein